MPIKVLSEEKKLNLSSWTIVGAIREGIVYHVAILANDVVDVKRGDQVPVHQMGPPMSSIVPSSSSENEDNPVREDVPYSEISTTATFGVHVVAWLEDISEGEKRKMSRWYRNTLEYFPETTRPKLSFPRPGKES